MKKLALFLLVITLFGGCDDDDKPQNWTRYEYLDELKDYAFFQKGTWWVYKKIPGGDLDTIEVTKTWIDTLTLTGNGNTIYYEDLFWVGKSRLNDYEYKFYHSVPPPLVELFDYDDVIYRPFWISKSKPGSYQGETIVFFTPLRNGHSEHDGTHSTKLLSRIDTLTIQGQMYADVRHFEASHDATFSWGLPGDEGGIVQYYWAPHIGIIKKEHMTKNIKWELVESHIVQ